MRGLEGSRQEKVGNKRLQILGLGFEEGFGNLLITAASGVLKLVMCATNIDTEGMIVPS